MTALIRRRSKGQCDRITPVAKIYLGVVHSFKRALYGKTLLSHAFGSKSYGRFSERAKVATAFSVTKETFSFILLSSHFHPDINGEILV